MHQCEWNWRDVSIFTGDCHTRAEDSSNSQCTNSVPIAKRLLPRSTRRPRRINWIQKSLRALRGEHLSTFRIAGGFIAVLFFSAWRILEREAADIDDWLQLGLCSGELSAVQWPEIVGWTGTAALFGYFQKAALERQFATLPALVTTAGAAFVNRQYWCQCSGKFWNHFEFSWYFTL